MHTPSFNPLKGTDRILSLDIMRGIVLFGILLMNINEMGLVHAYGDPTGSGGATGYNLYTWIMTNMLFEGTMRALFSLLFGVGMFIFLDRLQKKDAGIEAANIYFRRLIWLLIFGLIHGYLLLWTGEILYDYALMGFLVFSFRNLSPKKLILSAFVLFTIGSFWSYYDYTKDVEFMDKVTLAQTYKSDNKELTKELKAADEKWKNIKEERTPEAIEEYNNDMRGDYFSLVAFLADKNQESDLVWPYRYDVWDILSMMLLGIALFKLRILSAEKSYRLYGLMTIIGYLIGLSVNYYETQLLIDSDFSFLSFSKTSITYDLGRVPTAIGHIGLIMLLCKLPILKWLKYALSAVGKMALTNYIMHSVFAMFIFTGVGFELFGTFNRHQLLYIVFGIWLFQLLASPIWLKYFQYGPLEWLWRYLSYLKRPAFKNKSI